MPRYKVLKSVAYNIGHSFTSLMNYAGDDYVMGHVLRLARSSGRDTLHIDFVSGEAGPPELLANPISEVPTRYIDAFWDLVQRNGSDRSLVKAATLTLRYNIGVRRPHLQMPELIQSPYDCDVQITDSRGRLYKAHFDGWWHPERPETSRTRLPAWWEFWRRFRPPR
jgi:hypothetical protein